MSQRTTPETVTADHPPGRRARPEIALAVIVACQLMVVLDSTVMNVALPKIQDALHFSPTGLSWVINAYTLAFGGLLLLGGRAGDVLGRRRVFVAGIVVFTAASLFGGFATSAGWLLAARTVQGVGAALAAPSALALIMANFAEGNPRNRALSVFTSMSATGGSIGLIVGGMLTDWVSWRWVLFINVPVGVAIVALAPRFVTEPERHRGRFDPLGALTSVGGMVALVYGFLHAASDGWGDGTTAAAFAVGAALLALFVAVEARVARPTVPLRLLAERVRAGAYLNMLLLAGAMFGMFYFLIQFLQDVLGYGPLAAGLGFLPMTVGLFLVAQLVPRLIPRFGTRRIMMVGMVPVAAGLGWLTQASATGGYASDLLGPLLLFGLGAGLAFMPISVTVLSGVRPEDSGAASGLLQTMQRVGGSLGLAVLVSVFGSARGDARSPAQAFTHGMDAALTVGTAFAVVALLVTVVVLRPAAR